MENFVDFVQRNKATSYILGLGFILFINCFDFPFYNLTKDWSFTITGTNIYILLAGVVASGIILAGLFQKKELCIYLCLY